MTQETQLKEIREACVRANPELKKRACSNESCDDSKPRLADVLLAIDEKQRQVRWYVRSDGQFCVVKYEDLDKPPRYFALWNLRRDSLEEQSDETLAFVHSLIKNPN